MHYSPLPIFSCLSFILLILLTGCNDKDNRSWKTRYDMLGSYSSPRVADLNGDGIGDIIMGAGGREERHSDTGVIAIDGATGFLLWKLPSENQLVGSAVFKDVTKDGVPDVFIGGRWAELLAIDGAKGTLLWKFFSERAQPDPSAAGWFNFSTPQFIPDQDGDGIEDLLVANGGNARAAAYDTNRPVGRLLVLSTRSGRILSDAKVPDGKETYMSVVIGDKDKTGNLTVYFGTGGETIGGNFYRTTLQEIMSGDLSHATMLASGKNKGFIAPPVLLDLNNDHIKDIIVNAVEGSMVAIDGATDSLLWKKSFPGTEAYTTPAPGFFNNNELPDVFCNFAIGTFPNLPRSIRFMLDGKTGNVLYADTIPSFQYASAVVADLNGDGIDEAIVNQAAVKRKQFENVYYSHLLVFDFKNRKNYSIGDTIRATNFASTPWVGDLDGDKKFDIIYSGVNFNDVRFDLEQPLGLYVYKFKTDLEISRMPSWGAYMGSKYDGLFLSPSRAGSKRSAH